MVARKLVVNCGTGEQHYEDLTPSEDADRLTSIQAVLARRAVEDADQARRAAAVAAVKARPEFADLVVALGL